jgi:hypothetical protein
MGYSRTALGRPYTSVTDGKAVPPGPQDTYGAYAHWAPRQELTSWTYPGFDCVAASWTSQYDEYIGTNSTGAKANLDNYKRCAAPPACLLACRGGLVRLQEAARGCQRRAGRWVQARWALGAGALGRCLRRWACRLQ